MSDVRTLAGKTAIVTGACGMLGAAIARMFSEEGCRVAIIDHDAKTLSRIATGINASGGDAIDIEAVAHDPVAAASAVTAAMARYGALDILVNAAGTEQRKLQNAVDLDWSAP